MRYLGGKSKIARRIAHAIPAGKILIEPFVGGGGATAALAGKFEFVRAYDIDQNVIILWSALKDGWTPPTSVSQEEYNQARNMPPCALRSFIGFGCSWGGKWFGGYARGGNRNYADESARSLLRDISRMENVEFTQADYRDIAIPDGCTIYADPPYKGTTSYTTPFDTTGFWDTALHWRKFHASVYVSEYEAPSPWVCVWEATRTRDMRGDLTTSQKVTEKLFTVPRRLV